MAFVARVTPSLCCLKIGASLFTQLGPDFVRELTAQGFLIFLDLKFHDIPNTVFEACTAAANLGVWMLNVHVSGGIDMMKAARRAIDVLTPEKRPLLIGVTMLTSMNDDDLRSIGIQDSMENTVLRMSYTAKICGLDGVVCSAKEAQLLRKNIGDHFLLVTPGIRLETNSNDDQKRVMTPQDALTAGVDYLVMGRSITQVADPVIVLKRLL